MMRWVRLYRLLVAASIRSRMQYKFNFMLSSVMSLIISVVEFLLLAVILLKFQHIRGWTLEEAGYLYAILSLSRSIYRSLASDVHHLEHYLMSGEMDNLLIRPVPVLLALMSRNFNIRFGEILQGLGILVICMGRLMEKGQITWTAIPWTVLAIASGTVLLFAIGLITASFGFWITRVEELQNITEDAARTAVQYPLVIYPKWLQGILIGLIPVAFANYLPSLFIIRHTYGPWIIWASVAVSCTLFMAAMRLWNVGISRYQSTGS